MIYLLYGEKERELEYKNILEKLRKENQGITEKVFDASQGEEENFLQSVGLSSMFGGRELLILKRTESLKKLWDFFKIIKKYNTDSKEIIIDYSEESKKISKKALKEANGIFEIIEVKKDKQNTKLLNYIQTELNIDKRQAYEVFEIIGNNIAKVRSEVEKLKNFFYEEEFDLKEAKSIMSISKEYSIFEMIEKFLAGDMNSIILYLKKSKEYMLFIYTLAKELKIILKLNLLAEQKKVYNEFNYNKYINKIYPAIKDDFSKPRAMHPYALFKKIKYIGKFENEFLEEKLYKILEAEIEVKTGVKEVEIAIELLILNFYKNK